jgi:sugar phosphate isomerase/epimerase
MSNRRKFLQESAALALTSVLLPRFSHAGIFGPEKSTMPIGLQLYTVGNLMADDPKGTLQKLAAIGYKELESAGSPKGNYYGFTPKEFSAMVKDAGMTWRSAHVGGFPISMSEILKLAKTAEDSSKIKQMEPMIKSMGKMPNLRDNAQQLADEAAQGGLSYLVCSAIPMGTMDELKMAIEVLSKAGEACKKNGVQFAYHNHNFEFVPINGVVPLEYLFANTDKDQVKSEMDLGWTIVAGQEPIEWFKKYPGRFPLWHVKDMDKATKSPTELGSGYIDFKRIFDQKNLAGMKYFFIEQDGAPKPMDNVTNSFNNLNKILS